MPMITTCRICEMRLRMRTGEWYWVSGYISFGGGTMNEDVSKIETITKWKWKRKNEIVHKIQHEEKTRKENTLTHKGLFQMKLRLARVSLGLNVCVCACVSVYCHIFLWICCVLGDVVKQVFASPLHFIISLALSQPLIHAYTFTHTHTHLLNLGVVYNVPSKSVVSIYI